MTKAAGRRTLRRVLIANRGEIAVRVARALAERGIESVAVASDVDAGACHVRAADRVVAIGGAKPGESYLRGDVIIAAAKSTGCDAIHPGYGFLSQNATFADAVEAAGIAFIGPGGAAMRLMGDKSAARRAMAAAGVPVVPGFEGNGDESAAVLAKEADRVGFPLLVKASAGGGGRGMRIVRERGALAEALAGARREAEQAFGDGRVFLERFVENARHVEIQVIADARGNCVHLLERECSIQRRYQKIVEESPSPVVDDALRERMGKAAVDAARACGYRNAGTIEFLVAPDRSFFFLEMNTRLQVEHPVTELVTGIDLVHAQLAVAEGSDLPWRQDAIRGRGHAIECRVNAEDPVADFAPSIGRIHRATWPRLPGVRVDAGYETGDEISRHYDGLIAKVIVHAADRPAAIARMQSALARTAVLGVATNVEYVRAILAHPVFAAGGATTAFIPEHMGGFAAARPSATADEIIALALAEWHATAKPAAGGHRVERHDPWGARDGFRTGVR